MATEDRGFASMDEQKRKDIASKGGQAQGTGNSNPANFANDKKKASKAGKKGGENSRTGGSS